MLCAHATENHGIIAWIGEADSLRSITPTRNTTPSAIRGFQEADMPSGRLISMAAPVDQPIMIFHVSTEEGARVIRDARGQGREVLAETCPRSICFSPPTILDKPGVEGAKWMCSPPPLGIADQDALWPEHGAGRSADRFVRPCLVSFRRDRQIARRHLIRTSSRSRTVCTGTAGAPAAAVRRDGVEGAA